MIYDNLKYNNNFQFDSYVNAIDINNFILYYVYFKLNYNLFVVVGMYNPYIYKY